jgi:drug/metabolite transporter superfamily protein YnfA
MSKMAAIGILFVAAVFEAGGDALVRKGLHQGASGMRWVQLLLGAAVLFAYGVIVNTPDWDFGKLLGLYVVFFFLVAQVMSVLVFHQEPSTSTWIGGGLILAGGVVLGIANA